MVDGGMLDFYESESVMEGCWMSMNGEGKGRMGDEDVWQAERKEGCRLMKWWIGMEENE